MLNLTRQLKSYKNSVTPLPSKTAEIVCRGVTPWVSTHPCNVKLDKTFKVTRHHKPEMVSLQKELLRVSSSMSTLRIIKKVSVSTHKTVVQLLDNKSLSRYYQSFNYSLSHLEMPVSPNCKHRSPKSVSNLIVWRKCSYNCKPGLQRVTKVNGWHGALARVNMECTCSWKCVWLTQVSWILPVWQLPKVSYCYRNASLDDLRYQLSWKVRAHC
jgi:hypothetical protein